MHSKEEEAAFDPSLLAPETATSAEFDSDGLESDDEVKAVMEQLDESVPLQVIISVLSCSVSSNKVSAGHFYSLNLVNSILL